MVDQIMRVYWIFLKFSLYKFFQICEYKISTHAAKYFSVILKTKLERKEGTSMLINFVNFTKKKKKRI